MTSRGNTSGTTYTQRQPSRRAMSTHVGCHHGSEPSGSAGISEGVHSNRGRGGGGGSEFCCVVPGSMSCPISSSPSVRDPAHHNPSRHATLQMLDIDSSSPLRSSPDQTQSP